MSEIHGSNSEVSLVECAATEQNAERIKKREYRKKKLSKTHSFTHIHTEAVGSITVNIKENNFLDVFEMF